MNSGSGGSAGKRKILIGSQREPEAVSEREDAPAVETPEVEARHVDRVATEAAVTEPSGAAPAEDAHEPATPQPAEPTGVPSFPPPRLNRVSDDVQREIDAALSGVSLESLMDGTTATVAKTAEPEIEGRYRATVMKVAKDSVFFGLQGHYEGVASVRQFDELPEVGSVLDVVVNRYNRDENLYEVSVPGGSVHVQDWSDLQDGVAVEARITGHNAGGLECEVNTIRGFIPVSQVSLYRVDNLEEFVGEKFACIVTEANPSRRNLVLSRRAYLEREQQAAREKLLETLEVGQTFEGVVRSVRDFGAFVDLGGVDGLIHVSKLSWDRIQHPSEVLEEGQRVKVKIEKIDPATHKISLTYRDLMDHPWENAEAKYPVNATVTGVVSKIMDFGAFVRLAPGVEGLVHISELAHHRVSNVHKVVKEGQEVTVKILSIDPQSQRMSLSMKAMQAAPADAAPAAEEPDEPPREPVIPRSNKPLKGGTNRPTGGDQFGLKW
jgi:small subunit ribosomal protein S1